MCQTLSLVFYDVGRVSNGINGSGVGWSIAEIRDQRDG